MTPRPDPELLLAHGGYVRSLAQRLAFDEHQARDVEQETWLAALEHAPRDPSRPRAWLAALVRNLAIKAWRGSVRRQRREFEVARAPREVPTPQEILERESLRREMVEAVLALDEPWRSALVLRYLEELSPAEVARRLGVPLETARTRLKRGLRLLRERLARRHGRGGSALALLLVHSWRLEPPRYAAIATLAAKSILQGALIMSLAHKVLLSAGAVGLGLAWLVMSRGGESAKPAAAASAVVEVPGPGALTAGAEIAPAEVSVREAVDEPVVAAVEPAPETAPLDGSLLVRVVWGDDKQPASDVEVRVYSSAADDYYQDSQFHRSGGDGTFLVDPIRAGAVGLFPDRGGHGRTQVEAGQRSEATIEIEFGFDVEGSVRDASGRPVPGAEIYLYRYMGSSHEGSVVGRSAEDGRYFVRSIGEGLGLLSARAPGRAPTKQKLASSTAGATVHLDLAFEAGGGSIEGRVLGPDGEPCAGAMVVLGQDLQYGQLEFADGTSGQPPAAERATADAHGRFRFPGVAEGTHLIQARAKGLAPWKGEVSVLADRSTAFDIALVSGARLAGLVRDESGAPVARAEVTTAGGYGVAGSYRRTEQDGTFVFEGLPVGEFEVAVEAEEKGSAKTVLVGVDGADLRWDPVLGRGLVLRVRVDGAEKPLTEWWAQLQCYVEGKTFFGTQSCDAQGRMEFVGCPDQALLLQLYSPQSIYWPVLWLDNVRAAAGELVLEPDPAQAPSVRFRGRILGPDGAPIGGAQVVPSRLEFLQAPILHADVEGRFDIGPAPPGDWGLNIKAVGYPRHSLPRRELAAGEVWEVGDVVLQPGGTAVVRLSRQAGLEADKVILQLLGDGGRYERVVIEGDLGRSGPIAPGRYRLFGSGQAAAFTAQDIVVESEQETHVEVELRPGVPIEIAILEVDGSPCESRVSFSFESESGLLLESSFVRRWSSPLSPGAYRFRFHDGSGRSGELELEVEAGVDAPIARSLILR